ncbi:hypothetical protein ACFQPF_09370 [Fictibacillus iocasae]|uniref:IDEAL domain-containing protein n=1 Tax=Fictibacillus iocasae TaxID=2715437 RepID=A0ABW2NRD0_9BACL
MAYEEQPTSQVMVTKLQQVLDSKMTREAFHLWAYKWVENFDSRDHLTSEEDKLHQYFIVLLAIDLEVDKDIYFHSRDEQHEWMKKIQAGERLSS